MGRLRTIANASQLIKQGVYFINDINNFKFDKKYKYFLEIGCGKGQFLIKNALLHSQNIYLGVDKYATIIYKAIKKANLLNKKLNNLFFVNFDIVNWKQLTKKKQCFEKIYLNFSDPWPKKRHEKKRLTSLSFLNLYKHLLKKQGIVEFKTDNSGFFEYSLNILKLNKQIKVLLVCKDLHKNKQFNIITTEYEDKFIKLKKPIYQIVWAYK